MSLELKGTVSATGPSGRSTAGYVVTASLIFEQRFAEGAEGTVVVPASGSARVAADKTFVITIESDGEPREPITIGVSAPDGTQVFRQDFTLDDVDGLLKLRVSTIEKPDFDPADDPAVGTRPTLTGRVVDSKGRESAPNVPVVIWTASAGGGVRPNLLTSTQPGGFFSTVWPSDTFTSAEGHVADLPPVPIRLEADGRLPRDVLLVLDLGELVDEEHCACDDPSPRAPEPADLVRNPAAFSQDLGTGCVDLTTPKRASRIRHRRLSLLIQGRQVTEERTVGTLLVVRASPRV